MKSRNVLMSCLIITAIAGFISVSPFPASAGADPFPSYGTGAIQVRIYTDYFCSPCRGMEPAVEPMLRKLVDRGVITLTLVDAPFSKYGPLYARYFLYALNRYNAFEHALLVRNTLFDAATTRKSTTKEHLEELYRSKGIHFLEFDPVPVFRRYNALIKEDHIDATPTCVIIRSVKKEKFIGGPNIINALNGLRP